MTQDVIGFLMERAGRVPVPNKTEQLVLGRRIQAGLREDATPGQKRAGRRAQDRLMSGNVRLAISVAKRFSARVQHIASQDHTSFRNCQR